MSPTPEKAAFDKAALVLDYDGVLAPLAATPLAVAPDAACAELLAQLSARLQGRLALLSGRTIADLDRLTFGAVTCCAGQNGLERRAPDGRRTSEPPHPELDEVVDILRGLARSFDGVLVEEKRLSVAVHYRAAPQAAAELLRIAAALARGAGLQLHSGSMVVELATPGWDKGRALTELMAQDPFRGAAPIYVGDDEADEAGFASARRLGGWGVLVGEPRRSSARWRIQSQAALCDWLQASLRSGDFPVGGLAGG